MNLILKAINKEKSKIRQFSVSFYKDPSFVIIYDCGPEYDSFLPVLVDGIKSLTNDTIHIFCTDSELFDEIVNVRKVKYTEDTVEAISPNIPLTDTTNPVK